MMNLIIGLGVVLVLVILFMIFRIGSLVGLVKGEKEKAILQFQKIAELNPGNQEVALIIQNIQKGKAALSGIVPPSPAPEKRKEPPVKDAEGLAPGQ